MTSSTDSSRIVPIMMAGGAGTRWWPLSRGTMPKQFIGLLLNQLSTFQATLRRVAGPQFDRQIVVVGDDFRFIAAGQMASLGLLGDLVLEPQRRDSAAAAAVGALLAANRGEHAVCLIVAADHVVNDVDAFVADCEIASAAARAHGLIMTLGIYPTGATGYGYIGPGPKVSNSTALRVARFVENRTWRRPGPMSSEDFSGTAEIFCSPGQRVTSILCGSSRMRFHGPRRFRSTTL